MGNIMQEHNITPKKSLRISKHKDKDFKAQMKRVFEAFKRNPSTMLMVSIETGVLRANICRYVAVWEKQGKIHLLKRELCKISKHPAGYYTTDTKLFTQTLKLF
jgi:hypothetical protein